MKSSGLVKDLTIQTSVGKHSTKRTRRGAIRWRWTGAPAEGTKIDMARLEGALDQAGDRHWVARSGSGDGIPGAVKQRLFTVQESATLLPQVKCGANLLSSEPHVFVS